MEFRPCIDIHNGQVKQIIGGSLKDQDDLANENYVSDWDAAHYARFYAEKCIKGGHVIMLNPQTSIYYEKTKNQAFLALQAYPGGLQIGGGINPDNAGVFLDKGASHVIVTSYVFQNGQIRYDRLRELVKKIGKNRLVLDISCRKLENGYRVVTDRWQQITNELITPELLDKLAGFCSEFLIHAVDVEGKSAGIEKELAMLLGNWEGVPITYAGGVHDYKDLYLLRKLGKNRLNVTIGSALDLFGGKMEFQKVLDFVGQ